MRYFLGIDNGGTSVKASIFNEDGIEVSRASLSIPAMLLGNGHAERDMEVLWQRNCQVIQKALIGFQEGSEAINGISFSGHGKGLYLVDENGYPVRHGILSTDSRANKYVSRWMEYGIETIPCQPLCLLKWLEEHDRNAFERTKWIFGVKDYIRYRLTGQPGLEITDFSGSGMMNLEKRRLDRRTLRITGLERIEEKLPPIFESSDWAGTVSRQAAAETGLKEGTPCGAGLFDIDACAAGMGLMDDSEAAVIAGTWGIIEYLAEKPDWTLHAYQNSIAFMKGRYMIEKSSPTSVSNFEWAVRSFFTEKWEKERREGEGIYEFVDTKAENAPVAKQTVLFFPFLYGGGEEWNSQAGFLGVTAGVTECEWIRAVMEGIVFYHRYQLESLFRNRRGPEIIKMGGGGVNSKFWVQMFADIFHKPVELSRCRETGTLGAAMTAAVAGGVYADYKTAIQRMAVVSERIYPNDKNSCIYRERYERYKEILESIWKERL